MGEEVNNCTQSVIGVKKYELVREESGFKAKISIRKGNGLTPGS